MAADQAGGATNRPHNPAGDAATPTRFHLVLKDQEKRIEMIARVAPSVVCVYDAARRGGGSGVLIDREGYGLTNYHVVAGMLETKRGWGGLSDGKLYEMEVLGIDPTGDVAMFRLVPPTPDHRFAFAPMGDSDAVRVGDTVFAMGNPFMLSEDHTPTVTMGLVTGIHRYQKGTKGNLIYSDCIQVDAPINPGSSGGPLFDALGYVVGINGRISVNTRGRFNVGHGYAITSNQIKRYIPSLRAGLLAKHGTLQATVDDVPELGVVFTEMIRNTGAHAAGFRVGDELLSIDRVSITSANHFASVMGTFPAHWSVLVTAQRDGKRLDRVVRTEPLQPKLKKGFTVDRTANERQVERVLRGLRAFVLGDESTTRPMQWRWSLQRDHDPGAGDAAHAPERFLVSQKGDGPMRLQELFEGDKIPGRLIECDAAKVTQRQREGGESFDVPQSEAMVLSSLYVLQRHMLSEVGALELTGVSHLGGDRLIEEKAATLRPARNVPIPVGVKQPAGGDRADPMIGLTPTAKFGQSRQVEVIEWPLGERAVARFAFDAQTYQPVRIIVEDQSTGAEVTVALFDFGDVGGVRWPRSIEVRGGGMAYRDTLSDWRIVP